MEDFSTVKTIGTPIGRNPLNQVINSNPPKNTSHNSLCHKELQILKSCFPHISSLLLMFSSKLTTKLSIYHANSLPYKELKFPQVSPFFSRYLIKPRPAIPLFFSNNNKVLDKNICRHILPSVGSRMIPCFLSNNNIPYNITYLPLIKLSGATMPYFSPFCQSCSQRGIIAIKSVSSISTSNFL